MKKLAFAVLAFVLTTHSLSSFAEQSSGPFISGISVSVGPIPFEVNPRHSKAELLVTVSRNVGGSKNAETSFPVTVKVSPVSDFSSDRAKNLIIKTGVDQRTLSSFGSVTFKAIVFVRPGAELSKETDRLYVQVSSPVGGQSYSIPVLWKQK
ncbi:hypothetical protein [Tepidimonas charontis]|jgi:hypothetical protein|uniref:DUF4426 domain-containing protein n=1 Tax=Tepidimonas charontis TaxID=2267262 RepID=A0A554XH32_9BURK|nr:hypothetical protein [Tepidimonas charontis]TSE35133.1 hypothetical protein Tchar_00922 [Tepidimonas charontis]